MDQAAERGDFRLASATAGDLINLLMDTGRAEQALGLVDRTKDYTRRAGLGPWTQLGDEGRRLQLLNQLGRYDEVLAEVEELRPQMAALPESSEQEEAVIPWDVREGILDAAGMAAMRSQRWEQCLELTDEIVAITVARGAPALAVAGNRFNAYSPLLALRRYSDAGVLLATCRKTFEAEGALPELGAVFSAMADLEDKLGHPDRAIAHEQTALRYSYLIGDPGDCSIRHFNLANYLVRGGGPPEAALAHRLACAVIHLQTGDGRLPTTIQALSRHLASFDPDPPPVPASFAELCGIVERVEGVRFAELFARLPTDRAATGDEALQRVLEMARSDVEPSQPPDLAPLLQMLAQAAAAGPDQLEAVLGELRNQLVQANPGQEEQIDAFLVQLRQHVAPGSEPSP
jgi:hypothetical protein